MEIFWRFIRTGQYNPAFNGVLKSICLTALGVGILTFSNQHIANGIELCSEQSNNLMRSVNIQEAKIDALCKKARKSTALLALSLVRHEDELGYCTVTLSLQNNSGNYLNVAAFNTEKGRFELFRFANILPGGMGYATAKSRILMDCDELEAIGLHFLWPVSIRLADRNLNGRDLARYKPVLMSELMMWKR